MITPTVGRVVHYWRANEKPERNVLEDPCAAIITRVFGPQMINVVVFSPEGVPTGRTSIWLKQEGGEPIDEQAEHCTWMPYQVGQAAKTEQLERRLAESSGIAQPDPNLVRADDPRN